MINDYMPCLVKWGVISIQVVSMEGAWKSVLTVKLTVKYTRIYIVICKGDEAIEKFSLTVPIKSRMLPIKS